VSLIGPSRLAPVSMQALVVIPSDRTSSKPRARASIVSSREPASALSRPLASVKAVRYTLNQMVQCVRANLDAAFAALADATRRGVLERLGRADASITELADKFDMTLTGMKKHVGVLEEAGLVITEKVGRVRTCKLGPRRLEEVSAWIEKYRQLWDSRFDELDAVVEELKQKERADGRDKRT
jgi:DNA-binding transcriptional ArsR family regulator